MVRDQEINNGPAKIKEGKLNQNGILKSLDPFLQSMGNFSD